MTPAAAALLGGTASAACVPFLRNQIRDGEIGIPFGTINPIRVRRDQHPQAFHFCAAALATGVALLLGVCIIQMVSAI